MSEELYDLGEEDYTHLPTDFERVDMGVSNPYGTTDAQPVARAPSPDVDQEKRPIVDMESAVRAGMAAGAHEALLHELVRVYEEATTLLEFAWKTRKRLIEATGAHLPAKFEDTFPGDPCKGSLGESL